MKPPFIEAPAHPATEGHTWCEHGIRADANCSRCPATEGLDEAAVARAITASWPSMKRAGTKDGPTPLELARILIARLSSPEGQKKP